MTTARQGAPSIVRPAIAYVALFSAIGVWFPYIAVFYRSIGIGVEGIGLLSALSAAVGMVAAPIWGAVADRMGSVRIPILVAGIWSALAAAALAVIRDPIVVAIAASMLSIGVAGLGPMLDSRTIQLFRADRDRYGQARAWGSLAFIVGALAIGPVIDRNGPSALFLVFAPGIAIAGIAGFALLGSGAGESVRRLGRADLASLRHRTLGLFFVGSIAVWACVNAVYTFFPIQLVSLGADVQLVGVVSALGALVEVPLMFAFPFLSRRVGGERLLVLAAVAWAARALAWSVFQDPLLMVVAAPLGGVGFALFYVGTVTYLGRVVPESILGTTQGLFSGTAFSLGSIVGGIAGGIIGAAIGLPGLFLVCAIGTALAGGLVFWAIVPAKRAVGLRSASDVG